MKKVIFFLIMILIVSCTKKEYKVNFTFSHFDAQNKKIFISDPADLYVVAKDSIDIESAIRDTLFNAYCLAAKDIEINNISIKKNNNLRNTTTFYLTIDTDVTYSFLNRFTKKYLFNEGHLTKTYTNHSPNLIDKENIDIAYLVVNKRNVKIIDYSGNIIIAFDIIPINKMKEIMKGNPNSSSKENYSMILNRSSQYIYPDYITQKHYLVENYFLKFKGVNSSYKNLDVTFNIENNYGINNELFVNEMTVSYSKNNIEYLLYLFYK